MADTIKLLEYAVFCLKIAFLVVVSRSLSKFSKFLCLLFQFSVVFMFLVKKFVQVQFIPISMSFVLNESLATYNDVYSDKCCQNFKRLGQEFNVYYDRTKHWKVAEIREVLNEVYALYSAFYISINVYRSKCSKEALNLYVNLRRLLALLSRVTVRPRNLNLEKLAKIEVSEDPETQEISRSGTPEFGHHLSLSQSEEGVSFLTLLHAENTQYVSEQHLTQAFQDFADLDFFEKVVSHANALYNIAAVLKREGMREHSRGITAHLVRRPRYPFGNLTFLRSLLLYQYKGIHIRIPVAGLNPGVIDTVFLPDKKMLAELERNRKPRAFSPAHNARPKHHQASLYGSDVYLRLVESYRSARNIVVTANPNGVCYEFLAMYPWEINLQVDNGRSVLLFNYSGVGNSGGKPEMVDMSRKCNYLVDYLNQNFNTKPPSKRGRKRKQSQAEGAEAKGDLVLNFSSTSLGGLFATKMCNHSQGTNEHDFALFENTFGDLRRLSMHFVSSFVGPLLKFVNLDLNCAYDYLKIDTNKIVVVDVNDEIIPLTCSLAHSVARTQVLPGVGRLSNSFMDYKYKTLQLINDSLTSATHMTDVAHGPRTSSESRSSSSSHADVDDIVTRMKGVKEILSVMGKNLNSTSQLLLSFLQAEANRSTKDELAGVNEYFTRLIMYGSMPNSSIPRYKGTEVTLGNFYRILQILNLGTKYFTLCEPTNEGELLVRVPPKVAVHFSVFLDELGLGRDSGDDGRSRPSIESDVSSIYSNTSDRYHNKNRVLLRDGEYYVDFAALGVGKPAGPHLFEHIKNDLRNFGLSVSRYRVLPIKLVAYFKLYSLLNVFNTMAVLDAVVRSRFRHGLMAEAPRDLGEGLNQLCMLIRRFLFEFVQVLIEEPFGPAIHAPKTADRPEAFDRHLDSLQKDYRKFGLVIPHFGGHCAAKTPLDVRLLNSLIRNVKV